MTKKLDRIDQSSLDSPRHAGFIGFLFIHFPFPEENENVQKNYPEDPACQGEASENWLVRS